MTQAANLGALGTNAGTTGILASTGGGTGTTAGVTGAKPTYFFLERYMPAYAAEWAAFVAAVNAGSALPVNTVPEIIALAKSKPGALDYGNGGVGNGATGGAGGAGGSVAVDAGAFDMSNNMTSVGQSAAGIMVAAQNSGMASLIQQGITVQANLTVGP